MVLYALCDMFCVFLLHRESLDIILEDRPLIYEVVPQTRMTFLGHEILT
jgi:hypothetical protein